MKKIIIIESIILLSIVMLIFTHLLGISWSKKVLFTSCQPPEIQYKSYDPYCLSILELQLTFDSKYIISIAKKIAPEYGHDIRYPAPGSVSAKDLQSTITNWKDDGIEIETYLNTKIFIPKKNFIGGR